jgi:hypothetical protein
VVEPIDDQTCAVRAGSNSLGSKICRETLAIVRSQTSGSPEARASSISLRAASMWGQPASTVAWASRSLVPKIEYTVW